MTIFRVLSVRAPSTYSFKSALSTSKLVPLVFLASPLASLSTMPNLPYPYRTSDAVMDLKPLGEVIKKSEQKRQEAFDSARQLQLQILQAKEMMESKEAHDESVQSVEKSIVDAVQSPSTRIPREANLSSRVEDAVQILAFDYFLKTSTLIPLSRCQFCTDEEYLAGAVMGLCQSLARYGMGRAIARDVSSVQAARDLTQECLDFLLTIDFRNGYLRRRYDGCKYALKSLETILYELSVTTNDWEPTKKKLKGESTSIALNVKKELDDLRLRMEHRDELREKLIKRCRDGQKAAKQAIFALHRGDYKRSQSLISDCEKCIKNDLLSIVEEEPALRHGSFTGVVEEYVEAKLFFTWLLGDDNNKTRSKGTMLKLEDFEIVLQPEEYLGGLCDLTGEIGRYAVKCGTDRNFEEVKHCLEANASISFAIQSMARYPSGIGKKMDQLKRSVEKLERMTYEMSLSEAAGGREVMHTHDPESSDS